MTRLFVPRINNIAAMVALCATVIAAGVLDLAMTRGMPDAHAAANLQLKHDLALERVICEKWGMRAGSENYSACVADLDVIRVKHDRRHVQELGNRRDGLIVTF